MEYQELYMDLEIEFEEQIDRKNRDRWHKRDFEATIDTICTKLGQDGRTQILLIKNRDSFYLPNGFKAHEGEKPELACIRGLCNIFSLSELKQMSKDEQRRDQFFKAFSMISSE